MSNTEPSTSARLEQRRRELVARCDQQRKSLRLQTSRWKESLSIQDSVHAGLEHVKRYQWWIVGAAAAVVVIKPRRVKAAMATAASLLATYRSMQPVINKVQHYLWQMKHQGRVQM